MVLPVRLETLQDLINEHRLVAKDIFQKEGEVMPTVLGYVGRTRIVIPLILQTINAMLTPILNLLKIRTVQL
mgnify:CR=1 FL=1